MKIAFKPNAAVALILVLATASFAKDKPKEENGQVVDSGTFGVFHSGTRVATETFSIQQNTRGSVISSEFKSSMGEQTAEQSSELQLTPSAEIRSYEWKELAPGKTSATVTPNDAFLIERFGSSDGKAQSQNFLLPASTLIIDEYFFVHREVMAWKYLATACKKENGSVTCPQQKLQFGSLNPHARSSSAIAVQYVGRDKLTFHGKEADFSRFSMSSEAGDWTFWLDPDLKLVRLANDAGIEVVRD